MYRLAPGVTLESTERGDFLLADRPLGAIRLNRSLRALVEQCEAGFVPAAGSAGIPTLEVLAQRGFLERDGVPELVADKLPVVSVVIPVKDRAQELERCLRSLARLRYPAAKLEVIVVDDGSRDRTRELARSLGAIVVGSGGRGRGPAAARNRGAREARGEILAFIDSDCTAAPEWLTELVAMFHDPVVLAVGGKVAGMHATTLLDRYEAVMSSLSLGERERAARGGSDTFYLPSCNLLVRRSAFLQARGFQERLHVGEDVDLTWRLRDRGGKIVYAPRGCVYHEHRNRLWSFVRRRFEYGTSEAMLQRTHPQRRKRMAMPPALTALLALVVLGLLGWSGAWFAATGVFGLDVLRLRSRFSRSGLRISLLRVLQARARAFGSLVYYLGGHGLRYYGVPAVLAAAVWPEFGVVTLFAVLWVGWVEYAVRKPRVPLGAFFVIHLVELLAYGAGVFWGCVREKSFSTYRPVIHRRMQMASG